MLGSSIGGVMNGPRGADKGTIAGMVIGGAIGAAVTTHNSAKQNTNHTASRNSKKSSEDDVYSYNDNVQFDTYNSSAYKSIPTANSADLECLRVGNIRFLDANNNHKLDNNEKALIVFDIYNRGNKTLYNVTPNVSCNSSKVALSAAATIESIQPDQGIRYKVEVVAVKKLKETPLSFTISFGKGKQQVVAKTFSI